MRSRDLVLEAINHRDPGKIPVDLGSTGVTGIHVRAVENLRKYYGLEYKPVKVIEPFQMLGEVDEELANIIGTDVQGIFGNKDMFGISQQSGWKEFRTFWGQVVLFPEGFNTTYGEDGSLLIYPEGDTSVPPCAKMPREGFFFDAIIRQEPIDEDSLNPENNLQEFGFLSDEDLNYWRNEFEKARNSDKAIITNFGGTAIGDIALVPGLNLKHPRGIRDVTEWYISTVARQDYLHAVFERQTDIAIKNLEKIYQNGGDAVDVVFLCGTDFGTQTSRFCSVELFKSLYAPYYKKMNDWIHTNTPWKTFKHSCGAVEPLIKEFINCGFDILNPVQINAAGMDPVRLKKEYGNHIVFWGGGVDTQRVLAFSTVEEVKKQVIENCRIFGKGGGFVFNTVHNIQANVPVENIVAMIETLKEINR